MFIVALQPWFEVTDEKWRLKGLEIEINMTEKKLTGVIYKCDGIHRVSRPTFCVPCLLALFHAIIDISLSLNYFSTLSILLSTLIRVKNFTVS